MGMSEEQRKAASARMKAMHAAKKVKEIELEAPTVAPAIPVTPVAEPAKELTDEQKILRHYQLGQGSLQDLARIYKVPVSTVLDIIGEGEMNSVEARGDMIDQSEAGPEVTVNHSKVIPATYTVD